MKSKENDLSQAEPAKRQRIDASAIVTELRVLVTNEESSVIIGRKGANAERVRSESGTFLSILKQEGVVVPDRVMVIKGVPSQISAALLIIVGLLSQNLLEKGANGAESSEPQITLRILLHKFLAGCIIGPAGSIMREIQTATNARISLSTDALPNSTEKTCSIIGTATAVGAAAERVVDQLTSNPLRAGCSTVLYSPGAPAPFPPMQAPGFGGPMPGYAPGMPAFGAVPQRGPRGVGGGSSVPPHLMKTEKVIIPDTCSGVVIGKGGSIIKEIKARTDTTISLADPDEARDRVVTISGSAQGIQAAIAMIRERVENYHPMKEVPRYQ